MKERYDYKIQNQWEDDYTLYVNYIVKDNNTMEEANVIEDVPICDLQFSIGKCSKEELEDKLLELVKKNNGLEFTLPKVSELSPLLQYIYDFVCESESNMCHIDYVDWEQLKEEQNFLEEDVNLLKKEIKKYYLSDYITLEDNEYKICGYGGLQSCFNDDRNKGSVEFER